MACPESRLTALPGCGIGLSGPPLMPTIATFLGISIKLYANDHQPPHFHAFHGDDEVVVGIASLKVLAGRLPSPRLKDVLAWAGRHQQDLLDRWQRCQKHQIVPTIAYP